MSSTRKTPYYNLSQFDDHDKPTWRGDYNGDMSKIDTGMQETKTSAIDAKTAAQNAQTNAGNALEYLAAMGVDSKQDGTDTLNRIETMDTRITTNTGIAAAFGINTIEDANELKTSIDQRNQNVDNELAKKANKTDVYTKTQADTTFAKKTEQAGTQTQLDALDTLTRPLTSWAAYSHAPNDDQKSISSSAPSVRMLYPTTIKTNGKYVTYEAQNGHFNFAPGSYLIMARGRLQNVAWSDSQKRNLRAHFANTDGGADITFDDCKTGMGDNQEYSMWGLLRVPAGGTVTATMNLSYWTPPAGVSATFKIEEASIAIILLQSETYDGE